MTNMPATFYGYILKLTKSQQIGLSLVTAMLALVQPVQLELQRRAIDDAVADKDLSLLTILCGLYLLAILAAAGLKFVVRLWQGYLAAFVVRDLRGSVYRNIYTAQCPDTYRDAENGGVDSGAVVSILSNEVEKLGNWAGEAISGPLLQAGTLVTVLGYMLYVEPWIALIAIGLYLPQFIIVPIAQTRMNRLAQEKAEKTRALGDFMVNEDDEDLFDQDPPDRFVNLSDNIYTLRRKFVLTKQIMKTVNNLLIGLGPFGVLAYGGYLAIQGEVQAGVILAFISGLERIGDPIRELITSYRNIADANMRYRLLQDSFAGDDDADLQVKS